jgi:hypothetical protein
MSNANTYRALRPEIRRILLHDWDPIGVSNVPEAQDEYDNYVAGVFGLLCRTTDPGEVARYLASIEVDQMGSSSVDLETRLPIAVRLIGIAIRAGLRPAPYPCPACGFLVFDQPPGSYEICPMCDWEDDEVQLRNPALLGGANVMSLIEAQRIALTRFPLEMLVAQGQRRDPDWRPMNDAEWAKALSTLSPGGHLPSIAGAFNEELYYWLGISNVG